MAFTAIVVSVAALLLHTVAFTNDQWYGQGEKVCGPWRHCDYDLHMDFSSIGAFGGISFTLMIGALFFLVMHAMRNRFRAEGHAPGRARGGAYELYAIIALGLAGLATTCALCIFLAQAKIQSLQPTFILLFPIACLQFLASFVIHCG